MRGVLRDAANGSLARLRSEQVVRAKPGWIRDVALSPVPCCNLVRSLRHRVLGQASVRVETTAQSTGRSRKRAIACRFNTTSILPFPGERFTDACRKNQTMFLEASKRSVRRNLRVVAGQATATRTDEATGVAPCTVIVPSVAISTLKCSSGLEAGPL
jgi:hypothetical protein